MNSLVVYESLWGNTRAVAEAIASGIGDGAVALNTAEATADSLNDAGLIVAGAPILGFALPTHGMRSSIESNPAHAAHPPDVAHPAMRDWLESLPSSQASCAAFETRIWWSPGSSAKTIAKAFASCGWREISRPERFIVEGTYGPLREGELERARAWGQELARLHAVSAGREA